MAVTLVHRDSFFLFFCNIHFVHSSDTGRFPTLNPGFCSRDGGQRESEGFWLPDPVRPERGSFSRKDGFIPVALWMFTGSGVALCCGRSRRKWVWFHSLLHTQLSTLNRLVVRKTALLFHYRIYSSGLINFSSYCAFSPPKPRYKIHISMGCCDFCISVRMKRRDMDMCRSCLERSLFLLSVCLCLIQSKRWADCVCVSVPWPEGVNPLSLCVNLRAGGVIASRFLFAPLSSNRS